MVTDLWHTHPNGVATVVANLKKELEGMGHVVEVLEPSQFFTVPFPLYPEMRLALFAWRGVKKRIREGKYDYVHIETEGPLGFFARNACMSLRIPFTTSFHGQHHLYAKQWLGSIFENLVRTATVWFHRPARATLVSTKRMQEQLETIGIKNVHIRPLGVHNMFFTRGVCPTSFEKPVFLYMGRVSSEKSMEEFLAADLPGTKLVVGDGPDRKRLEKKFSHAVFVGAKRDQELINWCSCADVMVMPSRTETFGLAMVEVLALGIPVAAHDVTGPREIIRSGFNGYLDEDIAKAAKACLTLSSSDCKESVRHYTWRASAETFFSFLSSIHSHPRVAGTSD